MIDPLDKELGSRLRLARTHRRISQSDLGAATHVSFQQVQKYEKGNNRISASTLIRMARVLQLNPSWFFEGLGPGEVQPMDPLAAAVGALKPHQREAIEALVRGYKGEP